VGSFFVGSSCSANIKAPWGMMAPEGFAFYNQEKFLPMLGCF
jgi:hypothetical protein